MTLTLETLRDWQTRERDTPGDLAMPPADFEQDWKTYLAEQRQKDGTDGVVLDPNAEIYAAMDVLENIFASRRTKLASMAEANPNGQPPTFRHEFTFESNEWFGLTSSYRRLDAAYTELKMGQPAPEKRMGARK